MLARTACGAVLAKLPAALVAVGLGDRLRGRLFSHRRRGGTHGLLLLGRGGSLGDHRGGGRGLRGFLDRRHLRRLHLVDQAGNAGSRQNAEVDAMRCAKGLTEADLKPVVGGEIDTESLAGPEVLAVEGVVDDGIPPVGAPFLRSLQGRVTGCGAPTTASANP